MTPTLRAGKQKGAVGAVHYYGIADREEEDGAAATLIETGSRTRSTDGISGRGGGV